MILTIEVDETNFQNYALAVASNRGWTPTITDSEGNEVANPVTPTQVLRDAILKFCEDERVAYETRVVKPEYKLPDVTITIE